MHTLYISSRMAATLQLDLVYIHRFALLVGFLPYFVFKEGMSAIVKLSTVQIKVEPDSSAYVQKVTIFYSLSYRCVDKWYFL